MGEGEHRRGDDIVSVTRTFERVRRGYDPVAVDEHLASVSMVVANLRAAVDGGRDESLDLVLRATKRSIEEALQDARDRADMIVADAHAAAARIRESADQHAARTLGDADTRSREMDADARDRYVEMSRLLDLRRAEVEALDELIADRQQSLRATAADLRRVAEDLSGPDRSPDEVVDPDRLAAMHDHGIEVVLRADPESDS